MLDALAALCDAVSLHTGDPGDGSANEVSGGSPAYARKTPTFAAAASGEAALSAELEFDIPAGSTVAWVGFWDGATFLGKDQVTSEAFTGQGTYTLLTTTKLAITD
jgi:hypothetical protein